MRQIISRFKACARLQQKLVSYIAMGLAALVLRLQAVGKPPVAAS